MRGECGLTCRLCHAEIFVSNKVQVGGIIICADCFREAWDRRIGKRV